MHFRERGTAMLSSSASSRCSSRRRVNGHRDPMSCELDDNHELLEKI